MSPAAVVVGGGAAGLRAAGLLAARGWEVDLHEASGRLGGVLHGVAVADGLGGSVEVDLGAESFATRDGAVERILADLGLAGRIAPPSGEAAWVVGPFGAAPLPAAGVLGIPERPLAADVRRAVGLAGSLRALVDRLLPLGRVDPDAPLADLVRRRMGERVLDRLVSPVVAGIYSRPAEAIAVREALPELRKAPSLGAAIRGIRASRPSGSAVAGLDGGIAQLAPALARDAAARGARLHLNSIADPEAVEADLVVDARGGEPATETTIALLVVDAPELDAAPRGTGVLVPSGFGRAKALTHSSAKWPWLAERLAPGRHVIRLSYADPEGADPLADAAALLGVELAPAQRVVEHRARWAAPRIRPRDPAARVLRVGGSVTGPGLARVLPDVERALGERLGE